MFSYRENGVEEEALGSHISHPSADILVAAPDCVKVLSTTGTIRFINAFGLTLLGATSADEILGKSYIDLWPVVMHEAIREALSGAVQGEHTRIEGLRSTLKGAWRWWEAHFHGVDGEKNQREIICIARDLTERRAREIALQSTNERLIAELEEAERHKVEFIAMLAHELRNPLAPIRSGLQVLKESANDRSAVEAARHIMDRQVSQMVRLLNDLLDIARVSNGKMVLQMSNVDLKTVVMEAVEASAPFMTKRQQTLSVMMPDSPIRLFADSARLIQVFSNILDNASKYTGVGGRITIEVKRIDTTTNISISDTGVGLEAGALTRVFETFTTVGPDATGLREGLGVGLSFVRQLVEMHEGAVIALSEGLGKGSQFVVTLPITHDGTAANPVSVVERHHEEVRILIVDDNVDAAKTLAMLLEYDDHIIRVAESGREALRLVADFRPEIVFLDIGMPGMDGLEVAKAVRAMTNVGDPVLVALTGWNGQSDRDRTKRAGFDAHLTKPADLATIEMMLHKVKEGQARDRPA